MTRGIIAALLAAGFAVLIAPYARAGTIVGETYDNVTLAVPRSGIDAPAMARGYGDGEGRWAAPEYTVGMVNPTTAFFSRIVCIWHKT